jgi:hypothetical protein
VPLEAAESSISISSTHSSGLGEKQLQRLAIQTNIPYYIPQFAHKQYKSNWAAFFFPMVWAAHRKLYTSAILLFLAHSFIFFLAVDASYGPEPNTDVFAFLLLAKPLVHFIGAAFANRRVHNRVKQVVSAANEASLTPDESRAYVEAKGGTSWIAPILFLVPLAAISALMLYYLGVHVVTTR